MSKKIDSRTVTAWLNHIGDCISIRAIIELRLHTAPKVFYKFGDSEQLRKQLQRTVDVLTLQLQIFEEVVMQLPDRECAAYRQKYYENVRGVDNDTLKSGKKQIVFALNTMQLIPSITSEGWPVFIKAPQGASVCQTM